MRTRLLVSSCMLAMVAGCAPRQVTSPVDLTEAQRTGIFAAADTVTGLTTVLTDIATANSGVQPSGFRTGNQILPDFVFGTCPVVTIGLGLAGVSIELDYGNGCRPAGSDVAFAGSITGTLAGNLFETQQRYTFDDFVVGDSALSGLITLNTRRGDAFEMDGVVQDFETTIAGDTSQLAGAFESSATFNPFGSTPAVDELALTLLDAGAEDPFGEFTVTVLTTVRVDPARGRLPYAGSVRVAFDPILGRSDSAVIFFTDETPDTGVILVEYLGAVFEFDLDTRTGEADDESLDD